MYIMVPHSAAAERSFDFGCLTLGGVAEHGVRLLLRLPLLLLEYRLAALRCEMLLPPVQPRLHCL